MQLVSANPQPQVMGLEELPGKSHYFLGNDPKNWHTDIPTYARVQYRNVYPGSVWNDTNGSQWTIPSPITVS